RRDLKEQVEDLVLHQRERDYRIKSEGAATTSTSTSTAPSGEAAAAGVTALSGERGHAASVPGATPPSTNAGVVRHRSIVSPNKGFLSINTASRSMETPPPPPSPRLDATAAAAAAVKPSQPREGSGGDA
ncbi:unnamed protein product, partial [Laminaria digitata]